MRFGYWGAAADLERVVSNPRGYGDLKTSKLTSLGEAAWREVISYSPAEPGLSRAIELPDGRVSAGGWSDLHPTLVLRNLGCDQVIYVTRRGVESGFATGVARLFGMDDDAHRELYDLGETSSSFTRSLAEADGVWCTDWNHQNAADLTGIEADAYNAPLEVRSEHLMQSDYAGVTTRTGLVGCSVGVTE